MENAKQTICSTKDEDGAATEEIVRHTSYFSKWRLYDEYDNSHDTVDDEIKQLLRIYVRHCL